MYCRLSRLAPAASLLFSPQARRSSQSGPRFTLSFFKHNLCRIIRILLLHVSVLANSPFDTLYSLSLCFTTSRRSTSNTPRVVIFSDKCSPTHPYEHCWRTSDCSKTMLKMNAKHPSVIFFHSLMIAPSVGNWADCHRKAYRRLKSLNIWHSKPVSAMGSASSFPGIYLHLSFLAKDKVSRLPQNYIVPLTLMCFSMFSWMRLSILTSIWQKSFAACNSLRIIRELGSWEEFSFSLTLSNGTPG